MCLLQVDGVLYIYSGIHYERLCVAGLDIPKHGEPAYPWESYGHGWTEKSFQLSKTGELHELSHGKSVLAIYYTN